MTKIIDGNCTVNPAHCECCRGNPDWRAQVGTPDVCPHGPYGKLETASVVVKKVGCVTCKPVVTKPAARP